MTSLHEAIQPSPWLSVWLRPRQTIEAVVAEQPRRFVLLLASLGAIAAFAAELVSFGLTTRLLDWRVLLGLAVAGIIGGIVGLYAWAFVIKWIGRSMGGRASAAELRAVLAWSAMPSILGLVIVLAILVASLFIGAENGAAPGWVSPLLQSIVAICGLWSFVVLMLMLARVQGFGFLRTLATYLLGLFLPLSIAITIRTFLFQPFSTPSGSMAPTLLVGDYFFVSKYAYGYSRYSFPFSPPLFSGRVFGSEPARGDVVVFRLPKGGAVDYVKRVVGLPGDRIQMKGGELYINGAPVQRERLPDFTGDDACGGGPAKVKRWRETLPNAVSYDTLDCLDHGFYDDTGVYTVPAGYFFVLGDNRDNSVDSRMLSQLGYVPLDNMIGRAGLIFFSRAASATGAASGVRTERSGMLVH